MALPMKLLGAPSLGVNATDISIVRRPCLLFARALRPRRLRWRRRVIGPATVVRVRAALRPSDLAVIVPAAGTVARRVTVAPLAIALPSFGPAALAAAGS